LGGVLLRHEGGEGCGVIVEDRLALNDACEVAASRCHRTSALPPAIHVPRAVQTFSTLSTASVRIRSPRLGAAFEIAEYGVADRLLIGELAFTFGPSAHKLATPTLLPAAYARSRSGIRRVDQYRW
jgi:hypothetical protein